MTQSNGRKAFYIIISILLACLFWFYVNNAESVTLSVSDVPVEFLNAETALANKGMVLVSGDDATVDLQLNMPRSLVYSFDPGRVRVIADLASVNTTGTQTVQYSVAYPPNVNSSRISVRSPVVRNVSVRVGEMFRKDDVEIRCKLVGSVAPGYVAGSVQLLPSVLEVWGQQSDVMQVSYAQVTLNIESAKSTIVEMVEYELYNKNDERITDTHLHASNEAIQVTMPVISATEIPLVVNFVEEPGVRLSSFDWELDTASVTLSGDATQIAQLKEIVLDEIVLSEIEDTFSKTYDIPIPEGLTNLSGGATATLMVANRDVGTRAFEATDFSYENFGGEERVATVVTTSLAVTLRGTQEALDAISRRDVHVVADLSDVTDASGSYTVPAVIRVDGDPDVGAVGDYRVTVRIGTPDPEATEGTEGAGITGEAEEGRKRA